jgi:hypothetical protein
MEKARQWNITVKAVPGNFSYYGYYSQNKNEIGLTTMSSPMQFKGQYELKRDLPDVFNLI